MGCGKNPQVDAPAKLTSMARDHRVTINGRRWLLRFTRLRGGADGWTYYDQRRPKMLIHDRLKNAAKIETIAHELLHASLGPTVSEAAVTEAARVIGRTLWRLGYRERD